MINTEEPTATVDPETTTADALAEMPIGADAPSADPSGPTDADPPVHPLAASFPMLEGEDFDALVDDIHTNGLLHPIVLDATGQLLDGRNRLKACRLAGVEPTFVTTEQDPLAVIASNNLARRHLTKGQQAMGYAMLFPEPTAKGGRGKTAVSNTGVSSEYITKARFVLRHARDLADKVMAGSSLAEAYTLAAEHKRAEEEYARIRNEVHDPLNAIVSICITLKANADKPDAAFLDQADFIRQVRDDMDAIRRHAAALAETM